MPQVPSADVGVRSPLDPPSPLPERVRDRLAELEEQRAVFDAVLEQMPVAFLVAEAPSGRLLYWNSECERVLGHPMHGDAEAREYARYGAVHDDGTPFRSEEYATARALAGEVVQQRRIRYRRGDGVLVWLSVSASPVRDAAGRITHAVCTFTDTTERQRVEEQVREGAERLGAALAASGTGTFRWDIRTNALDWDHALDRLFGLAPGETARSLDQFLRSVHPEDRARVIAACERCAADGADFDEEFRVVWPDGTVRWLYDKGRTFRDVEGRPAYMSGACVDTTERRQQQERLRLFTESMPQMAWTSAADGAVEYRNGRWYDFTGMPRPDGTGADPQVWTDFLHPDDAAHARERWARSIETGEPYEAEYRMREAASGEYRWFIARALPLRDAAGRVVLWSGTCTDIDAQVRETERSRGLALLGRQLAVATSVADVGRLVEREAVGALGAAGVALALMEPDGETLAVAFARNGMAPAERARWARFPVALDAPMAVCVRERRAVVLASRREAIDAYPAVRETVESGGLEASASLPLVVGERAVGSLAVVFTAPRVLRAEELRFVEQLALQCAAAVERARLFDEAERARAEAERANRAKAQFLAAMSHELRTPLNAIDGHSALVEEGIHGPVTAAQTTAIGRVRRSARMLLALINDLLNYARVEAGRVEYRVETVALDELLRHAGELVRPQMEERGLTFVAEPCPEDARVTADADKLQQVLLNLLTNALKFTPRGGTVTLRAACPPGATVARIDVADTGMGIAADQIERVFEPFVQVDPSRAARQQGVGLGLAISRDLARGMGGDLIARSAPGVGSTFTITLPRA